MGKFFKVCLFLLFIVGCSADLGQYSSLSDKEQQALQTYQFKHVFISGCVEKYIHEINRNYCDLESLYCNIPPESFFTYLQWMTVYQSCIAEA